MRTLELVVARHHEDLNWLRRVPKRFRITVYDKGASPLSLPGHALSGAATKRPCRRSNLEQITLPNVGREAHTYLHHVIRRYDELSDLTVFAQGKPFDHVPDFHKILHRIAFNRIAIEDFLWLGFIIDRDDADGTRLFQQWSRNPEGRPLPLRAFWKALWNEAAPEEVIFYPSAHFALTADLARRQPPEFYRKALDIAEQLPDAAHCFERTWDRVFGVHGIPPEYRAGPFPIYLRAIQRLKRHLIFSIPQ